MCTKEIDKVGARRVDWDRLAWEDGFGMGGLVRATDWAEIGERVRAEDGWPGWHRWTGSAWVDWFARQIGRRLVNGCVRRMAGRVGIGGLVREEDELAVLACVNYQGTAFFVCITKCCF